MKKILLLSFLFFVFILFCQKKVSNNDGDNGIKQNNCDTLLLRYSGFIKTYTKNGLIDSTSLTQNVKNYIHDSSDFYIDSIILKNDSFSFYLNDQNRASYYYGSFSVISDSVIFKLSRYSNNDTTYFIPDSEQAQYSQMLRFEGNRNQLKSQLCISTIIKYINSMLTVSSQSCPGTCNYKDIDTSFHNLGNTDSTIYWDIIQIYD